MLAISALYTYPIKSCGQLSHDTLTITKTGPAYDRHWMVTDADGYFLTQRDYPKMALIQPRLTDDALIVTAPNMDALHIPLTPNREQKQASVVVWNDTVLGADEGDTVAAWFSDYLGITARLYAMPDSTIRKTSTKHTPQAGQVGFADGYPILMISQASLGDLNQRLEERGKHPVTMQHFRPNIVVTSEQPYIEDTLSKFMINHIPFEAVKPCARCVITTIDPKTGVAFDKKEPLATLATYRQNERGVLFGQNVIHRGEGVLRVGDIVES